MIHRTSTGIIPISLGVLLTAISFIDIAGISGQRYFSSVVIIFSAVLVLFAVRQMTSWTRIVAIFFGAVSVLVSILQIIAI